jgi:SAM-dependent methyltransferase
LLRRIERKLWGPGPYHHCAPLSDRLTDLAVGVFDDVPFEDEQFDLTYSFKVLAHVPDIDAAVREAARVTRPGGHLLLEFYNPWSLRYLAKRAAGPQPIGSDRCEADISTRWDSPRAIRKLLPANLELIDYYGVRVLTPFAAVHRIPGLAQGLKRAEELASRSPLRFFGGEAKRGLNERGITAVTTTEYQAEWDDVSRQVRERLAAVSIRIAS